MTQPLETELRSQSDKAGLSSSLTNELLAAALEVDAHFKREAPEVQLDFELCEDGLIVNCLEKCLGLTGTIRKDGLLTFTFPAGQNLEQVVLTETAFHSRKPVLDGAVRYAMSKSESA
jgi:hypothetical protein